MVAQMSMPTKPESLHILISDQDEGARRTLRRCLEPEHWELYEVTSGREALKVLRQRVVHVMVSAVELPDTTGFDLVRGLRRMDRWVPFILTTDEMTKETLLRALLARAFTVLAKPLDEEVFRSALSHLVSRCYRTGVPQGPGEPRRWFPRFDLW